MTDIPHKMVNGERVNLTPAEIDEIDQMRAAALQAEADTAKAQARQRIDDRLAAIDVEAIRPLRAVVASTATQFDSDKLIALEIEAEALRAERAALASGG